MEKPHSQMNNDEHERSHRQAAAEYATQHADHEGLHTFLFVFLFAFLIGSQVGLYCWKKKYYRSFQNVTLAGLWSIPFAICVLLGFYRMIFVWTLFTCSTGYIIYKASKTPLGKETPRQVYSWFFWVYRICAGTAFVGYMLFMLDFLGITRALYRAYSEEFVPLSYYGWMLIFYGLYYGVLGRDCAEMCTDRLASHMGFTGKGLPSKKLPPGTCCICGEGYSNDTAITLNCNHIFHDWCIRGWTMIGKKDTCPYCSEKVSLKQLFKNPWEKQGILWAHLMDALRYLIVWNPIILICVQLVFYVLDPGA